jgi:hypothetical protein
MALPASGQISMNDIRVELGVPSQSPFGINEARLGTYVAINQFSPSKPPYSGQVSLASWYSYCQNCGYNSGTFYYSSVSAAAACAGSPNQTLYWSGALGLGTILYTDSTGNSEAAQGYWSNGTNAYYQSCPDSCYEGITSITACGPFYYEVQMCSGGATYIMNATDVTPVVGGVYKVYAPSFLGTMNGINCWTVISTQTSGLDDDATFGTNYGSCGTCEAASSAQFYISNSSLDIIIYDVTVNGVSLTGATGGGFPVFSGDSINAYSNQIGIYDVVIYYYNGITGQHFEGYDSMGSFYCNSTVGIGSHTSVFSGAVVNTSNTFQIYALDGDCS